MFLYLGDYSLHKPSVGRPFGKVPMDGNSSLEPVLEQFTTTVRRSLKIVRKNPTKDNIMGQRKQVVFQPGKTASTTTTIRKN